MKNLLLITLLLSFLVGNAQQNRNQFGPNSNKEQAEISSGINPGYPSEGVMGKYAIKITDNNPGFPSEVVMYKYTIRKTDNNPGYPSEVDLNRYTSRKTD